jgi:hypothetical protein
MRLLLSFLLLSVVLNISAQNVKLLRADEQSWSGGVAGHHGSNYYVTLQFNDTAIVPDTMWFSGTFSPLHISKVDTLVRKYDKKNNMVTYKLYAGESYNDMKHTHYIISRQKQDSTKRVSVKNYQGAMLITYQYKGIQHSFLIKTFNQLQALDYP